MTEYKKCLTIAGSDSGGGAGIQADLKTMSALGVYGMSAITAITAQNTCGVTDIHAVPHHIVKAQVENVLNDIGTDAIKIGMLFNIEIASTVADLLDQYQPDHVVLDPVMISTSGHKLMKDDAICYIAEHLLNRATVVTPNIDEAELLSGEKIETEADMYKAADILMKKGCKAVLMKGGHLKGKRMTDILFTQQDAPYPQTEEYIETKNTHGTGCTLSSAIASNLALGYTLHDAVYRSKQFITLALKAGALVKTGNGHGPMNHFFAPVPLKEFKLNITLKPK